MELVDLGKIAETVVALISRGDESSLARARDILDQRLNKDPRRVATAYGLACSVVIRRKIENHGASDVEGGINPQADALVFQALDFALDGNFKTSFHLLKASAGAGARRMLCEKVVQTLLAGLDRDDRDRVLSYTRKGLVTIEIGRILECGLLLFSTGRDRLAEAGAYRGNPQARWESFHLRSFTEVCEDIRRGALHCPRFRNAPFRFKSVDWGRYFLNLSTEVNRRSTPDSKHPVDDGKEGLRAERLLEVAMNSPCLASQAVPSSGDDHDSVGTGILALPVMGEELPAIHDGHHEIQENDVRGADRGKKIQRLLAI